MTEIETVETEIEQKDESQSFLPVAFISFLLNFILTELVFRFISFDLAMNIQLVRILLFASAFAGLAALLCSILPVKAGKIMYCILSILIPVYALYQLGIYNMMHSYTAVKTAFTMGGAMGGYVMQYIRQMPTAYWLMLLIPAFAIAAIFAIPLKRTEAKKPLLAVLIASIALDGIGLATVYDSGKGDLYSFPRYQEKAIREFGIERFLFRDIVSAITGGTATPIVVEEPEQVVEVEATPEPEVTPEPVPVRTIDDTAWKKMSEEDTDENRKIIDNYLMNRTVSDYNEATGLLEGKNLIYIMIEAFDYLAIDPDLTPTLYSMLEDGWYFSNHYTPKFDTGTSDSEFMGEISLVPRRDINVYADYAYNDWNESVFSIFNAQGYNTYAYHNWEDQFYPRREMLASQYAGIYENYDDLPFNTLGGWQSDLEMMELTVDKYINDDQFMTFYITSSTHFPYEGYDDLGNRYLYEINQYHWDYPEMVKHYISKAMELDKGLEYLINRLKEAGKFDDTAIVFYSDHHPLNMPLSYIYEYTTQIDRYEGMNEFRSPMVIYCPEVLGSRKFEGITGTYDILPTLLNLYNMDYDPRLYLGTDYFSEEENIVFFPDGDWATDKGIYYSSYEEFEAFDGAEVSDSYITKNTNRTENAFSISYLIYITDYFHHRPGIATPDDSKPAEKKEAVEEKKEAAETEQKPAADDKVSAEQKPSAEQKTSEKPQ